MCGTITTGISFDQDLLKEMDEIVKEMGKGNSRSRFVQLAVRNQIKLHKKQSIEQYLNSISTSELKMLKEIVNKRG
jgi:metal-responsive CopG/Arc/MetJ family transcriptional regulator